MISTIINAKSNKSGPWVAVVNNAIIFSLMLAYRVFRFYYKHNTSFHEYVMIAVFAVVVLLCTLSNSEVLPDYLSGPGIEEFRSSFEGDFFIIAIFSLIGIKKVLFLMSPLYLIA